MYRLSDRYSFGKIMCGELLKMTFKSQETTNVKNKLKHLYAV